MHLVPHAHRIVDLPHGGERLAIGDGNEARRPASREALRQPRLFPVAGQQRGFDLGDKLGLEIVDAAEGGRGKGGRFVDHADVGFLDLAGGDERRQTVAGHRGGILLPAGHQADGIIVLVGENQS